MKQRLAIILCVGLLLLSGAALAEHDHFSDPIPQAVRALDERYNPDADYQDCILVPDTSLGPYCLVLVPSRLYGYIQKDGEWMNWAQLSSLEHEIGTQTYFRRHAAGAAPGLQGASGLRYPDDRGFDLIKAYTGDANSIAMMMQFHWKADNFRLVGWQSGATGQFALWEDGLWVFFNSVTGERLGSARLDWLADYGLGADERDLPLTLADARRKETVTQATVETLFPGWTLQAYEQYNYGHMARAGYYRIEDGALTIRRVLFLDEEGGVAQQTDTLPIPLSEGLLLRLQTEDINTLLDTSGYSNTFLTDAAFDRAQIPVSDTVLQNDLQPHGLLLLTENGNGVRQLHWVDREGEGYSVRSSKPLPGDCYLDLFHYGDNEIGLAWEAQYSQCYASWMADGRWALGWMRHDGENASIFSTLFCGVQIYSERSDTEIIHVGSHPWNELFALDVTQLPKNTEEAIAELDRTDWVVVGNPDSADRLHLRAQPNTASQSLGKFYNANPVRVLERRDGWAKVRIGLDGRLEGWMMDKYLVFGDAMDAVPPAYPDLILREEYANNPLFAAPDLRETTGVFYGSDMWIAGVVGDELYIMVDTQGNTGYLPQSWFWGGNG